MKFPSPDNPSKKQNPTSLIKGSSGFLRSREDIIAQRSNSSNWTEQFREGFENPEGFITSDEYQDGDLISVIWAKVYKNGDNEKKKAMGVAASALLREWIDNFNPMNLERVEACKELFMFIGTATPPEALECVKQLVEKYTAPSFGKARKELPDEWQVRLSSLLQDYQTQNKTL